MFQKKQVEQTQQPDGRLGKLFSYLSTDKSMKKAFIAFGISALLMFLSLIGIYKIVTSPKEFVIIFTLAIIAALVGLAFWNGPQQYMNKIFEKQNILKTAVLFVSMFFSQLEMKISMNCLGAIFRFSWAIICTLNSSLYVNQIHTNLVLC